MRIIWGVLILSVFFGGVAVAFVSHETRNLYNELGREQQRLESLQTRWGQLTLEQGALSAPVRLDRHASESGFEEPRESQFQVLPEEPE